MSDAFAMLQWTYRRKCQNDRIDLEEQLPLLGREVERVPYGALPGRLPDHARLVVPGLEYLSISLVLGIALAGALVS